MIEPEKIDYREVGVIAQCAVALAKQVFPVINTVKSSEESGDAAVEDIVFMAFFESAVTYKSDVADADFVSHLKDTLLQNNPDLLPTVEEIAEIILTMRNDTQISAEDAQTRVITGASCGYAFGKAYKKARGATE